MRGGIPSFVDITDGKVHDVNVLDVLIIEPGSFYIMDRGYLDFKRLYLMPLSSAFFVSRAKKNLQCRRRYSHPADKTTGLRCDQIIILTGIKTSKDYPDKLRKIVFYDSEKNEKRLTFLTNNFNLPSLTIARLYKARWQVELFFKWIKQHLRIKTFFGTSGNLI